MPQIPRLTVKDRIPPGCHRAAVNSQRSPPVALRRTQRAAGEARGQLILLTDLLAAAVDSAGHGWTGRCPATLTSRLTCADPGPGTRSRGDGTYREDGGDWRTAKAVASLPGAFLATDDGRAAGTGSLPQRRRTITQGIWTDAKLTRTVAWSNSPPLTERARSHRLLGASR
jgi:hypothetical protein